jgi:HSP20 family protein
MSMIKWEPLTDLETMVDRAFNWPALRLGSMMPLGEWGPRVDICESDGTYLFKADIPGMNKEDIVVSITEGMLSIQGERKQASEETRPHFHRIERSYGSFSRSFSLPNDADLNTVHAHCENGELTVSITKKEGSKAEKAMTITVE